MPVSMNANFSCDVNKDGGVDVFNGGGPFNTIAAALDFLVTNFGAQMTADRHGVIHIGPGIYPETVQLTSDHNFIDLVGDGRDVTIVQFAVDEGFRIVDVGASNRVSNLTIHCTNTNVDIFAVHVLDNQGVRFDNCLIQSGSNTIKNLGNGSVAFNCDFISESTNAGQQLNSSISGLMDSCYLEGKTAGGGSVLIGTLYGEIRNSRLNTLQSGGGDVRTINFISTGGRLRFCTLEAQGRAIYEANGNCIIEFCYLSSEGAQSTPVVENFNGCEIRNCFFHQKSANDLPAVATGCASGSTVKIADTTFFAPNCMGNVIANLVGDGSRWERCQMIGADGATSGYALAASAIDRIVTVKNIVSNRLLDPLIRLTDNGLAAKTMAEAKAYNQKRWWSLQACGNTLTGANDIIGTGTSLLETHPFNYAADADADGPYRRLGTITTPCSINAYGAIMRVYNPRLYVKFRLETVVPYPNVDARFWCGFFTSAPPSGTDNLATIGSGFGLLMSNTRQPFFGVVSDGTTTGYTAVAMTNIGTVNDTHILMVTFDHANDRVIFQMDGQNLDQISTYLPGANDKMYFWAQLNTTAPGFQKSLVFYDAWCDFNP